MFLTTHFTDVPLVEEVWSRYFIFPTLRRWMNKVQIEWRVEMDRDALPCGCHTGGLTAL